MAYNHFKKWMRDQKDQDDSESSDDNLILCCCRPNTPHDEVDKFFLEAIDEKMKDTVLFPKKKEGKLREISQE
jgi:hypothetical protein